MRTMKTATKTIRIPLDIALACERARNAPLGSRPWIGDAPATQPPAGPGPNVDIFALLGIEVVS